MGQSNSRARPSSNVSPSSSSAQPHAQPLPESDASRTAEPSDLMSPSPQSSNKATARSSFRRSVLGLLPRPSSSHSSSNRKESQPAAHGNVHSLRKRWRSSRRWSKTPAQLVDSTGPQSAGTPFVQVSEETGADSPLMADSTALLRSSRPSTPFPSSLPSTPRAEVPPEGNSEILSEEERRLSQNIGTWLSGASSSSRTSIPSESNAPRPAFSASEDIEREITDFLSSPAEISPDSSPPVDIDDPPPPPAEAVPAPTEQIVQQAPRHFPPPGTLVVVQGVVNTTDAPHATSQAASRPPNSSMSNTASGLNVPQTTSNTRRRSASTPRSLPRSHVNGEERTSTMHRLSSFIPRPSNMLSRRLSASSGTVSSSNAEFARSSSASSSSDPHSSSTEEYTSTDATSQNRESPRSDPDGVYRPLSPGSIDVLGTLLSVAAAATAASLFSPGLPLASGASSADAPTQSPPSTARPLSPTPTAGLGNLGGLGGLAGFGLDAAAAAAARAQSSQTSGPTQGDRDGRDRIRNVWDSFRERLGLNPRNGGLSGTGPVPDSQGHADGGAPANQNARMRPGELMLAEMARALNAGLGLANNGERRPSEQAGGAETLGANVAVPNLTGDGGDHPLPPEDSFERFLLNLQADLRTVLTEDGANRDEAASAAQAPDPEVSAEQSIPEDALPASASVLDGDEADDEEEDDQLPFGESDDDDDDEAEDSETPTRHVTRTPTPIPTSNALPFGLDQQPETGNTPRDRGDPRRPAINLWRIYRFQPITVPQTQGQAATTSTEASDNQHSPAVSVPTGESAESSPLHEPHTPVTAVPDQNPEPTPSPAAPPVSDDGSNAVVPVIVVGLQSVDMNRDQQQDPHDQYQHEDETMPPDGVHPVGAGTGVDEVSSSSAPEGHNASGRPPTPRGRTWQSRAANALRTLRPGRRGASRGGRTGEGTGSRTFLIYVIGGYYPPNHHMVTGSETLDSYEALWELAELLGQVKPPVATKEDIDNSGLEIIRSTDLEQLEQEGKVASNCTDRCLICLDDYGPEQDIRLMSCRHAFHKDCVDRWLQVGRNNCPACRTKGVTTFSDSTPMAPAPPS